MTFPKQINEIVTRYRIDIVIARGAPAGALAYLSWRKTGIPFIVESFEPHAEYMLESGVWKRFDLRYVFQRKWERAQKKYARGLMPVAENYRKYLLKEGLSAQKVVTVPCSIDAGLFSFDRVRRALMRKKVDLNEEVTVGIYVGKFGGLYMAKQSFELYAGAFRYFRNFYLIILSPSESHNWINAQIRKYGLPLDRTLVKFVKHEAVSDYLNMSDFAYATYKPGLFKAFLSPVKVGEFWACGLPVVLTRGVGDESEIIERKSAGVLFDANDMNRETLYTLYERLNKLLKEPDLRTAISSLARVYRNPRRALEAYKQLLID